MYYVFILIMALVSIYFIISREKEHKIELMKRRQTYKKKKCEVQKQFNYKQLLMSMKLYDKKAHDNSSSASIFKELGL